MHLFAREHECMNERTDWPLGPALKAARERAGLSARKAADRTKGLVSSGRWYQLESGVQKTKGQEVPIGTTPETVVAAALSVGWDVGEALQIAGMTATEAVVRAIETKMFGSDVRAPTEDPDWILYFEALLEYVDNHQDLPASDIASLLMECEFLAKESLEAQPLIQAGIDQSIAYSTKLTELLTKLRDKQRYHLHGKKETDNVLEITTQQTASTEGVENKEGNVVRSAHWGGGDNPPLPPDLNEPGVAASRGEKQSDNEPDGDESDEPHADDDEPDSSE